MVFRELPASLQLPFLQEITKHLGTWLGKNIWQGDTGGSSPDDKFDGVKEMALNNSDVVDIASPLTLSAANIEAEIGRVYDAMPVAVRRSGSAGIAVSSPTAEFYQDAIHNQSSKGRRLYHTRANDLQRDSRS